MLREVQLKTSMRAMLILNSDEILKADGPRPSPDFQSFRSFLVVSGRSLHVKCSPFGTWTEP